jgi:2,4-dienoyl-CoA reductase-like NADH-dependent reductase (Old Yellow Enzyme family)
MSLFSKLVLPNQTVIKNRIAKAAMEENMADENHTPSKQLLSLYQAWADGGAGLILTGNVMVDRRAMTGPCGVVLENEKHLDNYSEWANVAKSRGAQVWMQINHPGRQVQAALGQSTVSPSGVALEMGSFSKKFPVPKPMTEEDISDIQRRFVRTAQLAEAAGFSGVQVHAAHGYLLSQFLSPLANLRQDKWGGSIENRARLLIDIVREIRGIVAPDFVVSIKLNSADFQRGGFSSEDAQKVVTMLNECRVDMIELSGGSFEAPAMQGQARDGRTLAREAYFLEFANDIQKISKVPLMLTGGIRRIDVAQHVIDSGVEMVGIATALAIDPKLPMKWEQGDSVAPTLPPISWGNKTLGSLATMAVVKYQLKRLSHHKPAKPTVFPLWALIKQQMTSSFQARRYKKWISTLSAN